MVRLRLAIIILITLFSLCFSSIAEDTHRISTFSEASTLALEQGGDAVERVSQRDAFGNIVEIDIPYKIFRVAGIGEGGFWTFYTIKYYPPANATVVIIYKPEDGTVVILRNDQESYSFILEKNHSYVVWTIWRIDKDVANGMLDIFLKPMIYLIINPDWTFQPEEEMRPDLCWEVR